MVDSSEDFDAPDLEEAIDLLMSWRVEDARAQLEALAGMLVGHPQLEADRLDALALVCDLEGRFAQADELLRRTAALDPAEYFVPPRLSTVAAHALLEEVLADLPAPVREHLANVVIEIVPMPDPRAIANEDTPPDILGLYLGRSLLEGEPLAEEPVLARIQIYQRNLERSARDVDELREQLRVTLLHEVGHHLGFDEEGLDEIGLA